jgi:hypothetical protein
MRAQVNGVLGPQAQLLCVGVITRQFWLKANARIGIDFELNPSAAEEEGSPLDSRALAVDLAAMSATIRAQNARLRFSITPAGLIDVGIRLLDRRACCAWRCSAGLAVLLWWSLWGSPFSAVPGPRCQRGRGFELSAASVLARRFASPLGVLGAPYRNPLDVSQQAAAALAPSSVAWAQWRVPRDGLWSHAAPGQDWTMNFNTALRSNVMWLPGADLPAGRWDTAQAAIAAVPLRFEGGLFGSSGIAQVNRRYWLQLAHRPLPPAPRSSESGPPTKLALWLAPQEPPRASWLHMDVLEHLMASALEEQEIEGVTPPQPGAGVLLRNAWPPDFTPPDPGDVYIHQQAFEFRGIPSSWVAPLSEVADEVWVPSAFNKAAFVEGGVPGKRVAVLPHGLEFPKFNLSVPPPAPPPSAKGFRILFNGGLLPRKGIDVLLIAYLKARTLQASGLRKLRAVAFESPGL